MPQILPDWSTCLYVQLLQTRKAFHQANSQIQLSNPRIDSQNLDTVQYRHQANSIQSLKLCAAKHKSGEIGLTNRKA